MIHFHVFPTPQSQHSVTVTTAFPQGDKSYPFPLEILNVLPHSLLAKIFWKQRTFFSENTEENGREYVLANIPILSPKLSPNKLKAWLYKLWILKVHMFTYSKVLNFRNCVHETNVRMKKNENSIWNLKPIPEILFVKQNLKKERKVNHTHTNKKKSYTFLVRSSQETLVTRDRFLYFLISHT